MTQFIIFAYVKRYLDDKVWCCMDRITAGKHVSFLCTRVEMEYYVHFSIINQRELILMFEKTSVSWFI